MSQGEISEKAEKIGIPASTVRGSLRVLKEKEFLKQINIGKDKGKYVAEDSLLIEFINQSLRNNV